MNDFKTFRKVVSYSSIVIFMLVTIVFFSSYIPMKKERLTNGRLYVNSLLLAYEMKDTNEYPYDIKCFENNQFDIKNLLTDSWGNPFFYERINNGQDYVLFSIGKDGIPFTEDDIYTEKLSRK